MPCPSPTHISPVQLQVRFLGQTEVVINQGVDGGKMHPYVKLQAPPLSPMAAACRRKTDHPQGGLGGF